MSLQLWSLGSGSSGNSFLVRGGRTTVLLDAGFPMRSIFGRTASLGLHPADIEAVLLTHEHSDHTNGAGPVCRKLKVPLVANEATLGACEKPVGATETLCMPTGSTIEFGDILISSFAVSHDAAEAVGYVFQHGRHRAVYVTDTGTLTPNIVAQMAGAHLIVLESNHDVRRLMCCPYPDYLKQRILGDRGHLSNVAAGRAIAAHSRREEPAVIWLAHLSRENNSPRLAARSALDELKAACPRNVRLHVAKRDVVSLHWDSGTNWWQPTLF
jgi:phosphoribosyl 1,2-cyclic phosphodiesterase